MKKSVGLAIGLSLLLSACSNSSTPKKDTSASLTYKDEIPAVPRNVVAPGKYVCPTTATGAIPLSQILNRGPATLDQDTPINLLKTQNALPSTLQDMLYSTKSIINNMYYGYSTVDLEALHKNTYQAFKKSFPNNLNSYIMSDDYFAYSNVTDAQQDKIDELMNAYINGVGDEHTFYRNRASTQSYKLGSSPSPVLGINYDVIPSEDGVVLTSVRLDSPAWNAGLRRGDVIVSVNGTALTRTAGTSDDDLYNNFRKVISAATVAAKPFTMTVKTAGKARDVSVTGAILKGTNMPWGEVRIDASGKSHYYLRIPTFSSVAPERSDDVRMPIASRVHQLVAEAQSKGVDNIVVDLRGNGGGALIEFVGAAAAFAPEVAGESTYYVDGSSIDFGYSDGNVTISDPCGYSEKLPVQNTTKWNGKVTVLVDSNSASASEMFSTNMQMSGKKVIGTKTVGVGNTSTYALDLPAGRNMSITAGRTYLKGKPVAQFITPDIQSKDDLKQLADTGVDNTLQAAYDSMK